MKRYYPARKRSTTGTFADSMSSVCVRFFNDPRWHEVRLCTNGLYRHPLILSVCVLGVTVLTRNSTVTAQESYDPSSAPNVNQVALSNEDIAQSEARLKKLEEELLKTLSGQGSSEPVEQSRGGQGQSVKITGIRAPSEEQPEARTEKQLESQQRASSPFDEKFEQPSVGSLKELEHHPALQGTSRRTGADNEINEEPAQGDKGLSQRLAISESQVEILSRELDTTRKRLKSAELRSQRPPSTDVREYNSGAYQVRTGSSEAAPQDESSLASPFNGRVPSTNFISSAEASHSGPSAGMTGRLNSSAVASIAVERTPLRVGPGQRESTLFMIPRHAHVTIEHRTGEWYRVITDSGNRGWLPGSVLVFDLGVPPSSTVRISGFRGRNEPPSLRY